MAKTLRLPCDNESLTSPIWTHGSMRALRDHLTTALDAGYIPREPYVELGEMAISAIRIVNGYMRVTKSLNRSTDIRRGQ